MRNLQNQIKVGDEIEIGLLKKKMKLKVVGIFSGKDSKQTFASEMIENRFFVSMKTLAKIKNKMEYTTAKYLVKDPKQVDAVMGAVKKLDIDFGKLNIENNFAKKADINEDAAWRQCDWNLDLGICAVVLVQRESA